MSLFNDRYWKPITTFVICFFLGGCASKENVVNADISHYRDLLEVYEKSIEYLIDSQNSESCDFKNTIIKLHKRLNMAEKELSIAEIKINSKGFVEVSPQHRRYVVDWKLKPCSPQPAAKSQMKEMLAKVKSRRFKNIRLVNHLDSKISVLLHEERSSDIAKYNWYELAPYDEFETSIDVSGDIELFYYAEVSGDHGVSFKGKHKIKSGKHRYAMRKLDLTHDHRRNKAVELAFR